MQKAFQPSIKSWSAALNRPSYPSISAAEGGCCAKLTKLDPRLITAISLLSQRCGDLLLLIHADFQGPDNPLHLVVVAVMYQRQADHAILGFDTEVSDQAVGIKMTVFGAYALVL